MASINRSISSQTKSRSGNSDRSEKSIHTYTPRSHENLIKEFSRVSHRQMEVKTLKREINRLKVELRKADVELKLKEDRIQMLEKKLLTNLPSKDSHVVMQSGKYILKSGEKVEENSGKMLSDHFGEVVKRNQNALEQKDRRIRELQALLAQCMNCSKVVSEKQIGCYDLSQKPSAKSGILKAGSAKRTPEKDNDKPINRVDFTEAQKTIALNGKETKTILRGFYDLDRLQQYFMNRLDFEEELDALFWEIENTRFQMLQHNTEYDSDQRRAYEQEFDVFRKTRDQLLKELGGMRAAYNEMKMIKSIKSPSLYKGQVQ